MAQQSRQRESPIWPGQPLLRHRYGVLQRLHVQRGVFCTPRAHFLPSKILSVGHRRPHPCTRRKAQRPQAGCAGEVGSFRSGIGQVLPPGQGLWGGQLPGKRVALQQRR